MTAKSHPILIKVLLLIFSPMILWGCHPNAAPPNSVSKVIDGDTIVVKNQKIRLLGIDTPETRGKSNNPGRQCFADEAKAFLQAQLTGQQIRVVGDPEASEYDKYGRLLAWIYVGKRLINQEIVAQGYGFATRYFPHGKKTLILEAETEARRSKLGVWQACKVSCKKGYCEVIERIEGSR